MPRVDDRCVLSRIIHALKSCGLRRDCPEHIYGPKETLCNRSRRWAELGLRKHTHSSLAGVEGVPARPFIDSSCITVRRTAGGVKGGGFAQDISIAKGGHNIKLHTLGDEQGPSARLTPDALPYTLCQGRDAGDNAVPP